jgi:hypothetical protein
MAIEIGLHHRSWGPHLHQIGEGTAIAAHPGILSLPQNLAQLPPLGKTPIGTRLDRGGIGRKLSR